MKKIIAVLTLCLCLTFQAKGQFGAPVFSDTSDIFGEIDTPEIEELEPVKTTPKEDDPNKESAAEVQRLELEAQKLKLEKEIAELKGKTVLTKEEKELLKIKNENLKLISLKEQLLLEQELTAVERSTKSQKYPDAVIYGQQFFRDGTFKLFQKSDEVVATENYVLGTGDVVQLEVWGYRYWSKSYTVSDAGSIDISGYQKIFVKGLTLKQAKSMIGSRLSLGGDESSFSVTVTRPRLVSVTILGEVFAPGSYTFPATNSAFNALASMGGPSDIGSVRNIYIKRDGKIRDSFDAYEYFNNVLHQRDVFLQNNDYILVMPAQNVISVNGSVRRPGKYELKNGEGLLDLLQFAGGAMPNTYFGDVLVSRIRGNAYEVVSVNLDSLRKKGKDFILNGGEFVNFKSISQDNQYAVLISGAVSVPGSYRIREGMRISSLIKNANGLTTDAYVDRGYLVRTNKDYTKTYITFSPAEIMKTKGSAADLVVNDRDSIFIFSNTEIQKFNKVKISGAVYRPITANYISGLKLGELLFMAGGLTEDADKMKGFIIRTKGDFEKELIPFNPGEVQEKGDKYDFEILPKDEVTIYSRSEFLKLYKMDVQGAVKRPSSAEFAENTRVSDLINMSGGLESTAYTKRALIMHEDLKTGLKTAQTINLEEILKNPGSSNDIVVGRNDVLRVFSLTELKTDFNVAIYGEVRKQGEYQYADNMTLQNIVDLAGGLEFVSAGTQVEVVRNLFVENGTYKFLKPQVIVTRITDNLLLDSGLTTFKLQPFDKVFIRKNPNFIPLKLVYIQGAVKYPGFYALQGEDEKLNSLITRAGGLRPDAMIDGISMIRIKKNGDSMLVVPSVRKAMRRKKSNFNLIVKGGDQIIVPFAESLVVLSGDMNIEGPDVGAYYKKGKRARYYIKNFGGGFTKTSDRRSIVVVHASGARVGSHNYILFRVTPRVTEGSTVVVNSKETAGAKSKFNIDQALNKFLTRATAVLSLIGIYKIATAK
ncbi:MAG: SLBB domain-containing protein [Bacteroidia bacterium]|jgi:polysaccharide export outer membrane protein|nr:SLBB domain-containing protein [Bacteroidia bacterium]